MITYEVHVSHRKGHAEVSTIVKVTDPETDEVVAVRSFGSVIFRTQSEDLAQRVRDTWNDTARRADDRVAWIKEYHSA